MSKKGFTLIELLVVVAIIGVLAAVVLASLNSAREKGKIAAVKSNLKNMATQMELAFSDNGNYSGINTGGTVNMPNTVCTGPIANIASAIKNTGGFSRCLTISQSSLGESAQRWGATGLIYGTTAPVKAWSVSSAGVVTWDPADLTSSDLPGGNVKTWDEAASACAAKGARLPTIEELKTLADAQCEALGSADCTVVSSRNPPGFSTGHYWSGTTVPSNNANAYEMAFYNGYVYTLSPKVNTYSARCVR